VGASLGDLSSLNELVSFVVLSYATNFVQPHLLALLTLMASGCSHNKNVSTAFIGVARIFVAGHW